MSFNSKMLFIFLVPMVVFLVFWNITLSNKQEEIIETQKFILDVQDKTLDIQRDMIEIDQDIINLL